MFIYIISNHIRWLFAMISDVVQYHKYRMCDAVLCLRLYCFRVLLCWLSPTAEAWSLEASWRSLKSRKVLLLQPGLAAENKIVESKNSMIPQQITFEATGETTWEVPAEFAEVRHWVVMVSLMIGILGNYKMFAQIWIRWLDAKKWFRPIFRKRMWKTQWRSFQRTDSAPFQPGKVSLGTPWHLVQGHNYVGNFQCCRRHGRVGGTNLTVGSYHNRRCRSDPKLSTLYDKVH